MGDVVVDDRAGRHHQDDGALRPDGSDQSFEAIAPDQVPAQLAGLGDETPGGLDGAIVDGHPEAVLGDVERQIGAHGAEADQSDIGTVVLCHGR